MRKIAALLLLILVLLSSTALAFEENEIVTVYDLVGAAEAYHQQAKSVEAAVAYELAATADGEPVNMAFKADLKYIIEPLQMQVKMSVPEQQGKLELYAQQKADVLELYGLMDSEAEKFSIPFSGELIEALKMDTTQKTSYKNLAYRSTEKQGGKSVYVISAALDLNADNALSQLLSGILGDSPGTPGDKAIIPATLYIDTKTLSYTRIELDMTGLTNSLLSYSDEFSVSKYSAVIDYKYNGLKRLKVPASVIRKAANN